MMRGSAYFRRTLIARSPTFLCVNDFLDRLATENPKSDRLLLYVEQPFSYELEDFPRRAERGRAQAAVHDESCDSWQQVRVGRKIGLDGVALENM